MPARTHRHPALRRFSAALATATLASTAAVVAVAPAPATARTVETDFGFQATAYGTRVFSHVVGAESGKSAFSYIPCTRLAGRTSQETLAEINLPADSPTVQVEGVASSNRTYRDREAGVDAGVTSVNSIARVRLGGADTPRLTVEGLTTRSTAWATTRGRLRADNTVTATDISLVNLADPDPGGPLGDLLDSLDQGIDEVLQTLIENGGTIEVPGLGTISVGYDRVSEKPGFAVAGSFVLKVLLYGPDGVEAGGDDSLVGIGHSRARINRDLPAAVMSGVGYGASAKFVDGVLSLGRLGEKPLPCRGTDGKVTSTAVAGLDFPLADGQLVAEGLTGRAFGEQFRSGKAVAWTSGGVSDLRVGPVEIKGIVGRATVTQARNGSISQRTIAGSRIGEILVDGESLGGFTPSDAEDLPDLEIPGVATVEFFVTSRGRRSVETSAVVLTLLDDSPGVSTVRLGNAKTILKRN